MTRGARSSLTRGAPLGTFGVGPPIAQVVETLTTRGVSFPCGIVDDGLVKLYQGGG